MEKRKCNICQEETKDKNHIDKHPHIEIIEKLYYHKKSKYFCNLCPATFESKQKVKSHLYMDHDKLERFIEISSDISGKYFTY